ncbi:MAG TPA: diguanylate cyclase, partial [Thermoanaerobaculia bacterium]
FATVLDIEWRRARRANTPMSLVMIDIDYFKDFNDTYGHQQGDECLRKVAEALTSVTGRAGDLVARYGGEEFAIILAATDALGGGMVADLARGKVEALNIPHRKSPISPFVTISLGIAAVVPGDNHSAEDLVAAADAALYQVKEQGRNRSVTAEKVDGHRAAP